MNAEALIGTVLGTSTLQQLIGQGGMGAVYLAQQSRPRRQVAVKVLMPATALKPHQLTAFLERFRRETDAAASLEHPNIMPVYEYGERGGLAYLVMPHISGGTLRDVMERDGQMAFTDILNYLEQMAAALDFANTRGVIHRDIKPANMLLTPDGRLLLTDFGLVKLLTENQSEQMRLTGAGAPVGTPDYMSPEQVIGSEVDGRADQYSLGVVLFQMVTGTTPFQGETPMQIASQQLHMQPPAPRLLRPDFPELAEQVLLRAMAKRPDERFASAQEFANAFYAALSQTTNASQQTRSGNGLLSGTNLRKGGLFDPKWQNTGTVPAFNIANFEAQFPPASPVASFALETETNAAMPNSGGTGLLSRTGLFPRIGDNTGAMPAASINRSTATSTGLFATGQVSPSTEAQTALPGQSGLFGTSTSAQPAVFGQATRTGILPDPSTQQMAFQQSFFSQQGQTGTLQQFPGGNIQQYSPLQSTTSSLTLLNSEQRPNGGNTIKLTGPVKVVQVPVAPGQYVTGLLPVQKEVADPVTPPSSTGVSNGSKIVLLAVIFLILLGSLGGIFALTRARSNSSASLLNSATANPTATSQAQATATVASNVIFSDQLNQNIHSLPISTTGAEQYVFKDGAYHISNASNNSAAVVVPETFTQPVLAYQIDREEVKGDDTSPNNTFGMILHYTKQGNKDTFYTFEILNQKGSSQYSFYKYDSSKGTPWNELWHANTGKEFHGGQGTKALNTIKVFDNAGTFTFYVNNQKVGSFKDTSYHGGLMGMLVNLKGTEVAFTNLYITRS